MQSAAAARRYQTIRQVGQTRHCVFGLQHCSTAARCTAAPQLGALELDVQTFFRLSRPDWRGRHADSAMAGPSPACSTAALQHCSQVTAHNSALQQTRDLYGAGCRGGGREGGQRRAAWILETLQHCSTAAPCSERCSHLSRFSNSFNNVAASPRPPPSQWTVIALHTSAVARAAPTQPQTNCYVHCAA